MLIKKRAQREDVDKIVSLMHDAFPKASIYNSEYLNWLYWKNPVGDAVSLNVWDDETLVGHLAAIPQKVVLHGKPATVILLLNVATASSARGKGLFLDLVRELIQVSAEEGHAAIIGVANQQTYRAYVNKLGFQDVSGLDAHVELSTHEIDFTDALERAQLWHDWDRESLEWRMSNPHNPLQIVQITSESISIEGRSTLPIIKSRATIPRRGMNLHLTGRSYSPGVVLGLSPKGTMRRRLSFDIPDRLKPSPLRLVYINLADPQNKLDRDKILFSFLDFDAF